MLNTKYKILIPLLVILISAIFLAYSTLLKKPNVSAQTPTYDWPQVQNNPQHTGFSPEVLGTNISVHWTHPFQPEKVYPQVQAIVYQGKVFVGTEMGNMYALDATTGTQAWVYNVGAPILASVAAGNGNVYFGALDGAVYALNTDTGGLAWKKQLSVDRGFSTAPVFDDNKLMIGGMDGIFYALNPTDGNILWQYSVGAPIMQTAAFNNGKVFFGAMNMFVYGLNTTDGSQAWKSTKLSGMALKDYWPVVFQNKVFVRSMVMGKNFYALDENTGSEVLTLPQFDGQTMNGATTPPCVDRDGYLIVPAPRPNGSYGSGWGRLDASTGALVDTLVDSANPSAGFGNEDESFNVTCSQNIVIALHTMEQGASYTGAFDLDNRRWIRIGAGYTNMQMRTATLGGGGNPSSIANGFFYHISTHELVVRKAL